MKIAVICDLHLPRIKSAAQYDALNMAIENIKINKPDLTIVAGDISAGGEREAIDYFLESIENIPYIFLLGNSDIRDEFYKEDIIKEYSKSNLINFMDYRIIGISTPYPLLTDDDKKLLESSCNKSIIFMHHNIEALDEESKKFIEDVLTRKNLTLIHGHKHIKTENTIGKSNIYGVKGLDPDKVYGLPAVAYFEFSDEGIKTWESELPIGIPDITDIENNIGISCFHPETDIKFAYIRNIKNIEVQLRKSHELQNIELISKELDVWRSKGGRFLSVHMPELRFEDNNFTGAELWKDAIDAVCRLKPESITVHVPRVFLKDMATDGIIWRKCLYLMYEGIKKIPPSTKVGIENLHMRPGDKNDCNRLFGCTPEEVLMWIDALNVCFGYERCGMVLDIGHASNNGKFSFRYTRSMWYEICGKKTVAYHIHQVSKTPHGLSNHNAIENWYGNTISYASFFFCRNNNHLNKCPMFLEMKNIENCQKSMDSLNLAFSVGR